MTSRRAAPTLLAGVLALAYVIASPPSSDLAAELLRAKLFGAAPFGIWDNWWYAGHTLPGYSVLMPAIAWALTPQVAGAFAASASAAVFTALAYDRFGERAWLGSMWFAAATATNLLSGRLTFAVGLLPALGAVLALARGRPGRAAVLAALTALISPVAALFAALAGAAKALAGTFGDAPGGAARGARLAAVRDGGAIVLAALGPVLIVAVLFGSGGREPFAFSALWPIVVLAPLLWVSLGAGERALRAGVVLYAFGCAAAYVLSTPVGGNAARLAPLIAGPLLAMSRRPRRAGIVLALAVPLLYLQWQAAVRDLSSAVADPSTSAAYYRPLLAFLRRQGGAPFRVEVPFTARHWESYELASAFALARGWERQLDIEDNPLFYEGTLTPAAYDRWLHDLAVRFVALPDVALDYSAIAEARLIERGLPYLRPVARLAHWRVYAVANPAGIVGGTATLLALSPGELRIRAGGAGQALVRVRYSPYWSLQGPAAAGDCVAPAGPFTMLTLRRAGELRLAIDFSPQRIGSSAPRCS